MQKQCKKCNNVKLFCEFNKDKGKKDGLMSRCKECIQLYQKEWNGVNREHRNALSAKYYVENKEEIIIKKSNSYNTNRDKLLKRQRQKYKNNPEYFKNIDLKKAYGITLERYSQILSTQNNSCAICKKHKDNFTKSLAVDHCHLTGKVRGLLCTNCNRALGNLKDSIDSAINAVTYLEVHKNEFK